MQRKRLKSGISLASAIFLLGLSAALADQEPTVPFVNSDYQQDSIKQDTFPSTGLSPFVGPNVRCNSRVICPNGRGLTQSETALAISGDAVICGYNDFRGSHCPQEPPGYQIIGWAYSLDGGSSFTDGGPLPGRTLHRGDPWLATGPDGTIFYADIWGSLTGLAVLRGTVTPKGIDWSEPTVITEAGNFDKEAMAIDQQSGTIYITYTRFRAPGGIWLQTSLDGGLSFTASSVGTTSGVQGSFPAVGPEGELYVAWTINFPPGEEATAFAKSLDGGQTFLGHQTLGSVCGFSVPGSDRTFSFPQMAVDTSGGPHTGNIYVVWHSTCPSGNPDVIMTRSTDGGSTWDAPQVVNDDQSTAVHFFPTVSVDALGRVNVFFYDRRENPGTNITNLYFAQSIDGGVTFNENLKVTDVPSEWMTSDGIPNYGDYISSVSIGTKSCAAYTDSRDGDPDAYFVCVDIPPDPGNRNTNLSF